LTCMSSQLQYVGFDCVVVTAEMFTGVQVVQ